MATYKVKVSDKDGVLPGATVTLLRGSVEGESSVTDNNGIAEFTVSTNADKATVKMAGYQEATATLATNGTIAVTLLAKGEGEPGSAIISACAGKYRKENPKWSAGSTEERCVFDWAKFLKAWWRAFALAVFVIVAVVWFIAKSK